MVIALDHPLTLNSYQTPQGVIHGIQWVPAEATQMLPAGATPANAVNHTSKPASLQPDESCIGFRCLVEPWLPLQGR